MPDPQFKVLGSLDKFLIARSVDIEIGSGTGQFAIDYAKRNPQRIVVAIEHTINKFIKFERKLALGHHENLVACHTNAMSWIAHHLGERNIDRCFFYYPNPETNNLNRRWIHSPFFGHLLECLRPNLLRNQTPQIPGPQLIECLFFNRQGLPLRNSLPFL